VFAYWKSENCCKCKLFWCKLLLVAVVYWANKWLTNRLIDCYKYTEESSARWSDAWRRRAVVSLQPSSSRLLDYRTARTSSTRSTWCADCVIGDWFSSTTLSSPTQKCASSSKCRPTLRYALQCLHSLIRSWAVA